MTERASGLRLTEDREKLRAVGQAVSEVYGFASGSWTVEDVVAVARAALAALEDPEVGRTLLWAVRRRNSTGLAVAKLSQRLDRDAAHMLRSLTGEHGDDEGGA